MITIDNVQYRNLEEQVGYLTAAFHSGKLIDELGIKVLGVFPDLATAKATIGPPYEYGDAFEIGGTKPYNLYIYTRDIEDFFDFGPFPAPGPQGKVGPTPDISIKASVTNTIGMPEAIVTKTGTDEAPIFNFTFKNIKGDRGQTGPQGIQGPQGSVGPQGQQGIQGPKGETGPAGPAFVIAGTVANEGQLPAPSTLADNIAYLVGNDTDGYDLYVQLQDTDTWKNVGKVEGVQGPQGPAGAQGPQGPQGAQGVRGSNWYTGTDNPPPILSDLKVLDKYLNTITGNVYSYSGAAWSLQGNIMGPQGEPGSGGGIPTISVALSTTGPTTLDSKDYDTIAASGVTAIINTNADPSGSSDIYYKSSENDSSIFFTCIDELSSNSSDINIRYLFVRKPDGFVAKKSYVNHRTFYCYFSNNTSILAGFYLVLPAAGPVPVTLTDLANNFGYNDKFIPIAGTYDDGTGKRPVQYLYCNNAESTLYYLDSSNALASVDVREESIACIRLPNK